jgi:3-oxoacyl-[acyl-carrier-protein] synthase-3
MTRTRILGTGFVVGEHLVANDKLAGLMDTSDEWIRERSGIQQRYYVEKGTSTSDLGLGAARKALDDAGVAASEIDYIVFATMTPDHLFPGCGGILQNKPPGTPGSAIAPSSSATRAARACCAACPASAA